MFSSCGDPRPSGRRGYEILPNYHVPRIPHGLALERLLSLCIILFLNYFVGTVGKIRPSKSLHLAEHDDNFVK